MRASWFRTALCLGVAGFAASTAIAGVRAKPIRYSSAAEIRMAQADKGREQTVRQVQDSGTTISIPAPVSSTVNYPAREIPSPPVESEHYESHVESHYRSEPIMHSPIVSEGTSGSCCGTSHASPVSTGGCCISTPTPLVVRQVFPVVVAPQQPACSTCGGSYMQHPQGFSQTGSLGGWDYSMNYSYSNYGSAGLAANGLNGAAAAAYGTAFPNGYYRSGAEAGMYHFPYYSYRRPWYYPGQPSFHRDTDLVW